MISKFKLALIDAYNNFTGTFYFERRTDTNFSREDVETLRGLQRKCKEKELIITKADKGNTVVIMSRDMYINKMGVILSDSSKFLKVTDDDTLSNLSKFQNFCRSHRDKFGWSDKEYRDIYPTAADVPKLYGLPKIHQSGNSLRPILSMVGAFNHKFAKWLSKALSDEICGSPFMIRGSFSLCDLIGKSELHQAYLVSYDMCSLFTNIPIEETINVIVNKLYPLTPGVKVRYQTWKGVSRLVFKRSLIWCLCN